MPEGVASRGSSGANETSRLQLAVRTAVQLVDGCDHASITVVDGDDLTTRAASDPLAEQADLLQYQLGQGPCADSVRSRATVVSHDLPEDERWPLWSAQVHAELGVASAASLWLSAGDAFRGCLNLYGTQPHALVPAALEAAEVLAQRLGTAIAVGRESDELNAVGSRTVIGQAEGILMERLGIDATEAFGHLRRAAEQGDLTLAQVALDLVRTRELPPA